MLTKISILCFAASYLIALGLEVSRLFFRAPIRLVATLVMTFAGIFAHSVYIVMRATPESSQAPPLSSWFDWLLLLAWGVAATYLVTSIRRPQASLGIFMLPLVLALIGVATLFRDATPFPRDQSRYVWGMIHGGALLLGAVIVMLGFVAGIMYLVQSYRLKHKLPPRQGLKLPSLELLQRVNRQALVASSIMLAAGLLSGIALNLLGSYEGVPWSDPVVWTSAVLLLWLTVALSFEYFYKPAQQGRKVAYLTLASFVFLGLVLGVILFVPSEHATPNNARESVDTQDFFRPMLVSNPRSFESMVNLVRRRNQVREFPSPRFAKTPGQYPGLIRRCESKPHNLGKGEQYRSLHARVSKAEQPPLAGGVG